MVFAISEHGYRYQAKNSEANQTIAYHLITLTAENRDWGFGLCFAWMRNVAQLSFNHKRVYRIYCELALNLRIKPKRRLSRQKPEILKEPIHPDQIWSMDFMHDQLSDGRSYRLFNVLDDYRREGLAMDASLSFPAVRVIRTLDRLLEYRKTPEAIRCDNGPEFISHEFTQWAKQRGIRVEYIQPGNPQQNAYIERFNRTVRYSLLAPCLFRDIDEIEQHATEWLWFYNHDRPHTANQGKPPLMAA